MTKFIVNNTTVSLKTDVNLFFTITNGRIARSRSLTRRTNFKFMCLSCVCAGKRAIGHGLFWLATDWFKKQHVNAHWIEHFVCLFLNQLQSLTNALLISRLHRLKKNFFFYFGNFHSIVQRR